VLAHEDLAASGDRDGVLQVAAHGEDRRQFVLHTDRERGVAAGAAHHVLAASGDAHDGVVNRTRDGTVVHQERVGDSAQTAASLVVVDGDGLVAEVAAGGHQRERAGAHQEMMQGGVGEHDAQVGRVVGDVGGEG